MTLRKDPWMSSANVSYMCNMHWRWMAGFLVLTLVLCWQPSVVSSVERVDPWRPGRLAMENKIGLAGEIARNNRGEETSQIVAPLQAIAIGIDNKEQ